MSSASEIGSVTGRQPAEATGPATFRDVLEAERAEIRCRRAVWGVEEPSDESTRSAGDPQGPAPPADLVGLALSGGGIRSATFALGLLQGMSRQGLLKVFDYVSTVSGGGYTGGWWSAWLSRKGRAARDIFPPAEKVEPERWPAYPAAGRGGRAARPDASLSASGDDPVHHLRLFSNYLTPHKGLLSADTWRAATVVVRNLVLTWLVLLPLLLAAMVAGQLYFTFGVHPERNFLRDFPVVESQAPEVAARTAPLADALADHEARERQGQLARLRAEDEAREQRLAAIRERAAVAAWPLMVLGIWAALLTLVWMVHGSGSRAPVLLATLAGALAAAFIGWTLYGAIDVTPEGWPLPPGWTYVLVAGAIVLLVGCRALPLHLLMPRRAIEHAAAPPEDLLRNRVVHALSAVLVTGVVLSAVLAVSGFSHDLVWFLFDPASGGPLPTWVKQTGGWTAVLATAGAMLFTGLMGAPAGGEGASHGRPGAASRLLFAVTPVLAICLLAVLSATAGRTLIQRLSNIQTDLHRTDTSLLVAVALFLGFAVFETLDGDDPRSLRRRAAAPLAALAVGVLFFLLGPDPERLTLGQVAFWTAGAAALLAVGWWDLLRTAAAEERRARRREEQASDPESGRHRLWSALTALVALVGAGIALYLYDPRFVSSRHFEYRGAEWDEFAFTGDPGGFSLLLLAAALACGTFAAVEQALSPFDRRRATALLTVALTALSARAVIPFLPLEANAVVSSSAAVTVGVLALAWVVGLGWMANPNMLSLHAFYKARLVRAYLGASNPRRRNEEITESAVGDDLPLRELPSCERGAPYQLINTTLNLVGGRDLSSAQRSADSFLLSKHFCGSARTGYRPTTGYMGGKLTLGAAVAISGAAASPNMGSQTPSAALSMLLALLNVRLAFWAPTPNRSLWRDSQPRLWPFYLLREFLSQTHALSPYCNLSDGGHFDNSGLYALVARGCRYIVLSDCGADPQPCFEDVGNAIRRCRIDFGAEIDLRIDQFLPSDDAPARAHYTVGTITYSEAHARALGWRHPERVEERQGMIVWIRPSLTLSGESVDLRQYALENPVFPQQATTDQWYDEAQFESYRCLGEHTARQVFSGVQVPEVPHPEATRKLFEQLRAPDPKGPAHFKIDVVNVDGKSLLQLVETPAPARARP